MILPENCEIRRVNLKYFYIFITIIIIKKAEAHKLYSIHFKYQITWQIGSKNKYLIRHRYVLQSNTLIIILSINNNNSTTIFLTPIIGFIFAMSMIRELKLTNMVLMYRSYYKVNWLWQLNIIFHFKYIIHGSILDN